MRSKALAGTPRAADRCGAPGCRHSRIRHLEQGRKACGASNVEAVRYGDGVTQLKYTRCPCVRFTERSSS